jgi:type II secretory pathway component GspD/PulD (secretin)
MSPQIEKNSKIYQLQHQYQIPDDDPIFAIYQELQKFIDGLNEAYQNHENLQVLKQMDTQQYQLQLKQLELVTLKVEELIDTVELHSLTVRYSIVDGVKDDVNELKNQMRQLSSNAQSINLKISLKNKNNPYIRAVKELGVKLDESRVENSNYLVALSVFAIFSSVVSISIVGYALYRGIL